MWRWVSLKSVNYIDFISRKARNGEKFLCASANLCGLCEKYFQTDTLPIMLYIYSLSKKIYI